MKSVVLFVFLLSSSLAYTLFEAATKCSSTNCDRTKECVCPAKKSPINSADTPQVSVVFAYMHKNCYLLVCILHFISFFFC